MHPIDMSDEGLPVLFPFKQVKVGNKYVDSFLILCENCLPYDHIHCKTFLFQILGLIENTEYKW